MKALKGENISQNYLVFLVVVLSIVSPIFLLVGIVIGDMLGASTLLTADSISSWVSALATVAIAVLTFILAKETWYLRLAQNEQIAEIRRDSIRPTVYFSLQKNRAAFNFIDVVIKNCGKGTAYEIKFDFLDKNMHPIVSGDNVVVDALNDINMFKVGISALGVGQEKKSFLFSFFDLIGEIGEEATFSTFFQVRVFFKDSMGNSYEEVTSFDFSEYKGISSVGKDSPLHDMADEIEKIRKEFESWTSGFSSGRIHVNTYSSNDREDERLEAIRKREEYKRLRGRQETDPS